MKKHLLSFSLSFIFICFTYAQSDRDSRVATPEEQKAIMEQFDSSIFLRSSGKAACKCIDSISLADKDSKQVAADISECIKKEVTMYAMQVQLFGGLKSGNKNININVDENPNSAANKKYYYQLEKWLRDSCSSLKLALASQNKIKEGSVSKNPEAIDQYDLGIKLFDKENYKDALPYFKKAVEIDPQFAFAWDNLGVCYRQTDDYDKALEAYQRSLAIDPTGALPLQNIPIVYDFKKEYDKELDAYQSFIAAYPNDPETYFGIGRVYTYRKNDLEKGLRNMCIAYNLYIKMNSPYRVDAEKNIQYIYKKMKEQNKEDVFNKILEENNISAK
ncbi:tetratricopeptide repeat protein [Ferruginibacter albus]|uniref:tetratricopeptide repeat protein n=1 Tax=Ferruginibacter albus TaxID=2875540 RepID=UPI001CC60CFD|nr:tetratricopeptide repeat protein [Ferruginibacter albus]UAY50800.1 tetratricopeptide repeat protein [Ferruginibacter albus]